MKHLFFTSILIILFCMGCTIENNAGKKTENYTDTIRIVNTETYIIPPQELIDAYNQIYENIVWSSMNHHLKGEALHDSMKYGVEKLKEIIKQEPRYALAYTLLIQFQYALGLHEEMFATLDQAEKKLYDNPNIPTLRACILDDMMRTEEANEYYQKAIEKEKTLLGKGTDIGRDINLCTLNALLDSTYSFIDHIKEILDNPRYNTAEIESIKPFVESLEADEDFHLSRQEVAKNCTGKDLFRLEE